MTGNGLRDEKVYWEINVSKGCLWSSSDCPLQLHSHLPPGNLQREMPPPSLWGSWAEGRPKCCEWQGGTGMVTAESKQPRRTRGHPAGSDPAFPLVDWGTSPRRWPRDTVARTQVPKRLPGRQLSSRPRPATLGAGELNSCLI